MGPSQKSLIDVTRLPGEAYPRPGRPGLRTEPESVTYWPEAFLFRHPRFPAVLQHVRQTDIVPHRHEFAELVFVVAGAAQHLGRGRVGRLRAGDTFLVAGPQVHGYRNCQGLIVVNVLIRHEFFRRHAPLLAHLRLCRTALGLLLAKKPATRPPAVRMQRLAPEELAECLHVLEALDRESRSRTYEAVVLAQGLLLQLLATVSRYGTTRRTARAVRQHTGIQNAVRLLEERVAEAVPLKALAAAARLSSRSLLRHFQTATGFSPRQYQLRLRVAKAGEQLREGRRSIKEIATRLGFPDTNYFSRIFRKITGEPPSRYYGHAVARAQENPAIFRL